MFLFSDDIFYFTFNNTRLTSTTTPSMTTFNFKCLWNEIFRHKEEDTDKGTLSHIISNSGKYIIEMGEKVYYKALHSLLYTCEIKKNGSN